MSWFLEKLSKILPRVDDPEETIFETFRILPGVVLHHLNGQDIPEGYHTHPWKFCISICLSGGFKETELDFDIWKGWITKVYRRTPGSIRWWDQYMTHRIDAMEGAEKLEAWTLFITGPLIKKSPNWEYTIPIGNGGYRSIVKTYPEDLIGKL